jgi:hypothetical protein
MCCETGPGTCPGLCPRVLGPGSRPGRPRLDGHVPVLVIGR